MSITFPTSLDSFSNPSGTDLLENANAALDHDVQHSNANDAIEALEAKVGANSSAITTSHDYKLSAVTGTAKALTSGTSTQSVTGLTLVTPVLTLSGDATGDMYYRNASGILTRLPIGTTGQILDVSSGGIPEWIPNPAAADATYATKGVKVLDANSVYYVASTGSANAYVLTLATVPNALAAGQQFSFKANFTNTGSATLNVNSLTAKTIKKNSGTIDLVAGDIVSGQIVQVEYDGTNFQMVSPSGNVGIVIGNKVAVSTASIDVNTTLTETAIATIAIPANTLNTNNAVELALFLSALNISANSATACTFRLKYGSTTLASININSTTGAGATTSTGVLTCNLAASGATNTQRGTICINAGNSDVATHIVIAGIDSSTAAEDSTTALNLVVTVQFANNAAGNRCTTQGYTAKLVS
jgi:hypothetical protein